jgi:hypothetical protein
VHARSRGGHHIAGSCTMKRAPSLSRAPSSSVAPE